MINHNMDTTIPTIYDYYQSWLLRGDNPELYRDTEQVTDYFAVSHWDMYSLNDLPDVKAAGTTKKREISIVVIIMITMYIVMGNSLRK